MDSRPLLVSDPPHDEVDPVAAASRFGLTAAEVRMKANYGVPEIWFGRKDRAALEETAAALKEAGLKTVFVESDDLVAIPAQSPAVSVSFEDEGLRVESSDSGEHRVAYDAPAIGVFARLQEDGPAQRPGASVSARLSSRGRLRRRTPNLGAETGDGGASSFVDLYVHSDQGLVRVSIVDGITGVSGLDQDPARPSGIWSVVNECEARFENMHFDRRLVDMKPRLLQLVVPPGSFQRTGFSYATTALTDLLDSLSPALRNASQADLSSQLVYLTRRSLIA